MATLPSDPLLVDLGDGLVLRTARAADHRELAEFNATMHADASAAGIDAGDLDRRPLRGRPPHLRARAGRDRGGGHGDRPDRVGAVPHPPAVDLRRGHGEGRPTRAHRDPPGLPPPRAGAGPVRRRPRVEPSRRPRLAVHQRHPVVLPPVRVQLRHRHAHPPGAVAGRSPAGLLDGAGGPRRTTAVERVPAARRDAGRRCVPGRRRGGGDQWHDARSVARGGGLRARAGPPARRPHRLRRARDRVDGT